MFYLLAAISGFLLAVFFVSYDDLKQKYKRKRIIKRYKKLANGTPKKVVFLTSWYDVWEYRNYPLYVNGQVLGIERFYWWHCNDEYKYLVDSEGNKSGCLIRQLTRSIKNKNGRWDHTWGLAISTGPNFLGQRIKPSAVIDVY